MFYGLYALMFFVWDDDWAWIDFAMDTVVSVPLGVMAIWCHHKATLDPGYMDKRHVETHSDTDIIEKTTPTCRKCEAFKTQQVHHCKLCDKCVFLMDHHCFLTN